MKTDRPPAVHNLKTAASAVTVLLHLVALFDAPGLKTWAERLPDQTVQSIVLPPLEAWHDFTQAVGATTVRAFIHDAFFVPVRDAPWPAGIFAVPPHPPSSSPAPIPLNSAPPAGGPPLSASPAHGDSASIPSPKASTPAPTIVSPQRPLDIIVLGDSIAATALPPIFNQAMARNKSVRLSYETHSASSLARPVFFNWPAEIKRVIAARLAAHGRPFDLAVVLLGSNDAQTIRVGNRFCRFGSDCWSEEFRTRAADFMAALVSGCDRVYWLAVPPMRQEGYRERMAVINNYYREAAAAFPRIRYLPLDFLGDEQGRYVQAKAFGSIEREIRAADGVHLSYAGAELVVNRLIDFIKEDFLFENPEDAPASIGTGR